MAMKGAEHFAGEEEFSAGRHSFRITIGMENDYAPAEQDRCFARRRPVAGV